MTYKLLISLDLLLLTQMNTRVDWKSGGNDAGDTMITQDLVKKIRKSRGPILVEVMNFHDEFWIQAVKADLIQMLQEKFHEDQETGFEIDEQGRFGKDYQWRVTKL